MRERVVNITDIERTLYTRIRNEIYLKLIDFDEKTNVLTNVLYINLSPIFTTNIYNDIKLFYLIQV